ncbi:hypothetical protein [Hymenobacter tenuis]
MDEKLIGILAAAAGVVETEVAELIKTAEGVDTLSDHLEAKISKVRDDADKRATKKTRTEVEKALKSAGIADASFADLPAAIEALQTQASTTATKDLSDDQLLKHPSVVKELNKLRSAQEQAIESARQEERQKLEAQRQAFTKQQTDAKVRQEVERFITEYDPNFSPDPARAARQREKLVNDLVAQGGYQLSEDGTSVQLIDADGNLLTGKMNNPVKLADRVREYAEDLYGLPLSTDRQSPGLTPTDAATATRSTYTGPKTQQELDEAILKANTAQERIALNQGWEKFQQETPAA